LRDYDSMDGATAQQKAEKIRAAADALQAPVRNHLDALPAASTGKILKHRLTQVARDRAVQRV
jgi:hypothetical protein